MGWSIPACLHLLPISRGDHEPKTLPLSKRMCCAETHAQYKAVLGAKEVIKIAYLPLRTALPNETLTWLLVGNPSLKARSGLSDGLKRVGTAQSCSHWAQHPLPLHACRHRVHRSPQPLPHTGWAYIYIYVDTHIYVYIYTENAYFPHHSLLPAFEGPWVLQGIARLQSPGRDVTRRQPELRAGRAGRDVLPTTAFVSPCACRHPYNPDHSYLDSCSLRECVGRSRQANGQDFAAPAEGNQGEFSK